MLCSKMKKTVFIEIYPQQALNEKDIELTLEELTISNGKDYYHIIPNTIKFRGEYLSLSDFIDVISLEVLISSDSIMIEYILNT